ncbi:MAG: preprotein translocase subunit SecG [Rickettsiales bacterium]|jgi:preprotein translocase subunit SecG|nr:preprotein translocase subunit SecG [Rickettsiales bacterium]
MFSILLACLIVVAVIMVAVILLQKSEGSGMSGSQAASMFGGALTGASAGNFFTKLTAWLATIFFVICAALAFIVSKQGSGIGGRSEVREILEKDAASAPASSSANAPINPADIEMESAPIPEVPSVPEN